jgi:DNA-binding LacI/PurR family transcriptional regulator
MGRLGAEEIADKIRIEIVESASKPGSRLPSSAQVMEKFGGSPVTCMKAYKILEREGLVECIQGKGVFLKEEPPRCALGRVGLLSMDYGGIGMEKDLAFGLFMSKAADELRKNGCAVSRHMREDIGDSGFPAMLKELDGLIVSIGCLDPKTVTELEAWGKPVAVLQHEHLLPYAFHQVIPDRRPGFKKAVELFLESGADKITVVSNPIGTHEMRVECFLETLRDCPKADGIEVDRIIQERVPADIGRLTGRLLGEKLLKEKADLGALFTPSDFLAFGILDCFLARGLRPGLDFRLASYDNMEGEGLLPFGEPLLSSVDFPKERIARQAARLLLESGDLGKGATKIVRIPCELVRRKSA